MAFSFSSVQDQEIQNQIQSWYTQWILVDHLYAEFSQRYGISSSAMFTLRLLQDNPHGCSQHSICDYLTLPKQTASSILKSLEESGYITKTADEKDKRNKLACLTPKGFEFIKKISSDLSAMEEKAFRLLSDSDRKEFTRINEALTKALRSNMQISKTQGGFRL